MQALDTYRGETDTKGNNKKTEEQTWICTVQSLLFQSHDGRHAISALQLIHLRLTHFQCSQYHEHQSMLQIPSRLPRAYESPSPDHRTRDTAVVNTVLRYSNVLHLHQRVCHKVSDTMVRTSRFTDCVFSQTLLRSCVFFSLAPFTKLCVFLSLLLRSCVFFLSLPLRSCVFFLSSLYEVVCFFLSPLYEVVCFFLSPLYEVVCFSLVPLRSCVCFSLAPLRSCVCFFSRPLTKLCVFFSPAP